MSSFGRRNQLSDAFDGSSHGRFQPYPSKAGRTVVSNKYVSSPKRVVVSNIPVELTWRDLKDFLRPIVGEAAFIDMPPREGIAYVEFANIETAQKALRIELEDLEIKGKTLQIREETDKDRSLKKNVPLRNRPFNEKGFKMESYPHLLSENPLHPGDISNSRNVYHPSFTDLLNNIPIHRPGVMYHPGDMNQPGDGRYPGEMNRPREMFHPYPPPTGDIGLPHPNDINPGNHPHLMRHPDDHHMRDLPQVVHQPDHHNFQDTNVSHGSAIANPLNTGGDISSILNQLGPLAKLIMTPQVLDAVRDGVLCDTVFVSNLDYGVKPKQLRDIFRVVGHIRNCEIMEDHKGVSKGFGTVQFSMPEEALKAIATFHGQILNNRALAVKFDDKCLRKIERQYPRDTPLVPRGGPLPPLPAPLQSSYQHHQTHQFPLHQCQAPFDRSFEQQSGRQLGYSSNNLQSRPFSNVDYDHGSRNLGEMPHVGEFPEQRKPDPPHELQQQNESVGIQSSSSQNQEVLLQTLVSMLKKDKGEGGSMLKQLGNILGQVEKDSSVTQQIPSTENPGLGIPPPSGNFHPSFLERFPPPTANLHRSFQDGVPPPIVTHVRPPQIATYNPPGVKIAPNATVFSGMGDMLPSTNPSSYSVFVGNLPFEFTWQQLLETFKVAGNVVLSEIKMDGLRSRGCGVVCFDSLTAAKTAVSMFDMRMIGGRPANVRLMT